MSPTQHHAAVGVCQCAWWWSSPWSCTNMIVNKLQVTLACGWYTTSLPHPDESVDGDWLPNASCGIISDSFFLLVSPTWHSKLYALGVCDLLILLPCHMGSHMPSSEDSHPFLRGGCSYARSLSWLKTVPTEPCSAQQHFNVTLVFLLVLVYSDTNPSRHGNIRVLSNGFFSIRIMSLV